MKFVDEARIFIKAGDGGRGCVSFRREKYVPKGGPNGGDGGKGGDAVLVASSRLQTLLDFKYRQHFKARKGEHGKGANKHGKNGADCLIYVPAGTIVKDIKTGEVLADLIEDGERIVAARGGMGGLGNAHFATPTSQAPRHAQPGKPGEEKEILLSLKLLADVGIVGAPNAGKSTLLSKLTFARPKIAAYPFTTLVPNLGVVSVEDFPPFVIADIPGLIEGAHAGAGLGTQFLRHIERTRLLLHVVDLSHGPDQAFKVWRGINQELKAYDPSLGEKPQIVVLNKIDLLETGDTLLQAETLFEKAGLSIYPVSAVTGEGIETLKKAVAREFGEHGYYSRST